MQKYLRVAEKPLFKLLFVCNLQICKKEVENGYFPQHCFLLSRIKKSHGRLQHV